MKQQIIITAFALLVSMDMARAQTIPNGDFKKWGNEYDNCPKGWGCNNDADCKGKVTLADKVKGGAKLTVVHCWDPSKDDRSNNVNLNYDGLSAKIGKGKKVKISFDYSYTPAGGDEAYVKIDFDTNDELPVYPAFFYNDMAIGKLKPGSNQKVICYLNFDPVNGRNYTAPQGMTAESIRTTFGIMAAEGSNDVHKGSVLIINHVKFEME